MKNEQEDYRAAYEGRIGADRMRLGLSIIPNKIRGDMDKVMVLSTELNGIKLVNANLIKALEIILSSTCGNVGDDGYEGCIRIEASSLDRAREILEKMATLSPSQSSPDSSRS